MSSSHDDTEHPIAVQGVNWNEADWQHLLKKRMPKDWQEQAVRLKAWSRTRKLACTADLLRALLVYAASGFSFRQLGIWATLVGLGSLSERAWRKRLARAQDWIAWLLGALIGTGLAPDWLHNRSQRILLVDGSRLAVPAGTGDDVRLHCAYNVVAGRLESVEVTDRHSAEGVHQSDVHAGDIVVTDAGYPLLPSVQHTRKHKAFGVHRISDHQVRLEREDGKKIDLKRLVKHQGYGTITQRKVWLWDGKEKERLEVRLIIEVLPRQQAQAARARKRERIRRKHGSKRSLAPAWWAGVLLVATTVPQEQWSAQEVIKLYRARWQIELLFKRLKQGLQVHVVPLKLWERARVYTQLCLIVWCLHEQQEQTLSEQLTTLLQEPSVGREVATSQEEQEPPIWAISHWGLMQTTLQTLRNLLYGSWSERRLQDCLPQLQRYLVTRARTGRGFQETQVRCWLLQHLGSSANREGAYA